MSAKEGESNLKKGKKEDPGTVLLGSFISVPARVMEQIFLDARTRHMVIGKVVGKSQNKFTKGR